MAYETGTLATPKALFDRIVAQVQSTAFMGAGNEWELVYSYDGWGAADSALNRVIATFLVPGATGAGDWHIMIGLTPSTAANTSNWIMGALQIGPVPPWGGATWISRGTWSNAGVSYARGDVVLYGSNYYVCEVAHTSTATLPNNAAMAGIWYSLGNAPETMGAFIAAQNHHWTGYGKVWNSGAGNIPYWLFAGPLGLIWVTKSDSRYHMCIAIGCERILSAAQHPMPTLLAGNNPAAGDSYLDVDTNHGNFPLRGSARNYAVSYKRNGTTAATETNVFAWPPGAFTAPNTPAGRAPSGDYPLMPVLVDVTGTIPGVFITDPRGNQSESVITVAGQDYICFEDVFRGQSGHFLAIKMA